MKHRIFITLLSLLILSVAAMILHGVMKAGEMERTLATVRKTVNELMLTDLAVWTEARYTRHPSQADIFAPFQDYPSSIEHFPAGSIMAPPVEILEAHGRP